ncbi:MAG: tRNA pseudouridine(13) synthase TruD [Phycisphaerales bacterium]
MNASPTQPPTSPGLPLVDASPHLAPALFLTADVPGIGGALKQRPEDFLVEEIPAYDPCGSGEHIYLMVQKTNMPTLQMVQLVARHFNVKTSAVGYAGLKDKHAITRQVVSIHTPGKTAADFRELQHPKVVVLWADQHNNKLRRGHLKGNRFSIRVRRVPPTGVLAAKRVLERLEKVGVPNRFGEQRFGHALNNHLVGRAMLVGDWAGAVCEILLPEGDDRPEHKAQREAVRAGRYKDAIMMLPDAASTERDLLRGLIGGASDERLIRTMLPQARQFFVSSFQSAVFNAILDRRLLDAQGGRAPGIDALRQGDYAFKHENGSMFAVDDTVMADPGTPARLAGLGISPTGAMWGPEVPRCTGESGEIEAQCLANAGVRPEDLIAFNARSPDQVRGERRPLRVPVKDIQYEGGSDEFGHYVRCAFELPPGAFATVVMREIMKPDSLAGATPRGSREAMGEGAEAGEGQRPTDTAVASGPGEERGA